MGKMKKLIVGSLVGVLGLSLASCGKEESSNLPVPDGNFMGESQKDVSKLAAAVNDKDLVITKDVRVEFNEMFNTAVLNAETRKAKGQFDDIAYNATISSANSYNKLFVDKAINVLCDNTFESGECQVTRTGTDKVTVVYSVSDSANVYFSKIGNDVITYESPSLILDNDKVSTNSKNGSLDAMDVAKSKVTGKVTDALADKSTTVKYENGKEESYTIDGFTKDGTKYSYTIIIKDNKLEKITYACGGKTEEVTFADVEKDEMQTKVTDATNYVLNVYKKSQAESTFYEVLEDKRFEFMQQVKGDEKKFKDFLSTLTEEEKKSITDENLSPEEKWNNYNKLFTIEKFAELYVKYAKENQSAKGPELGE